MYLKLKNIYMYEVNHANRDFINVHSELKKSHIVMTSKGQGLSSK